MPVLNGLAMLAELRKSPATAAIPLVFLTGRGDRSDLREGMNLGADDYITKPFEMEEMLLAVKSRLARQSALNAQFQERLDQLHASITTSLPHELRTSLTGILGFASILLDHSEQIGRDELQMAANAIKTAGERLHRYMENYLLYAELVSGAGLGRSLDTASDSRPAEVAPCAKGVIEACARHHGRDADIRLALVPARVAMPETYLAKALNEVADNAFRYSPHDTAVEVTSEAIGNMIRITVLDSGRGITPDQIKEINAFVQFDRGLHEQQGLGLGLALTKRLVEFHGGTLEIERTPEWKTRVSIELPAATNTERLSPDSGGRKAA
jgi:signal transduction histidine kinase